MGPQAWGCADHPTHWKCLLLFCPVGLSSWPASWVIASFHQGQQMCTAGGSAVSGVQLCPSWAWAVGDGSLSSGPGCPLFPGCVALSRAMASLGLSFFSV